MLTYEASTEIDGTPDQVWSELVDVEAWASWDSGVVSVAGRMALGERLTITSEAAPRRAFAVKVTTLEPAKQVELSGGMPLGLFRGVRTYTLSPGTTGGTGLAMREVYTGPMVGLISRSMPDLQPSFDQFVRGLKQRVEAGRGQ